LFKIDWLTDSSLTYQESKQTYSSSFETYFKITVNFGCSIFDEANKTGNFTKKMEI